MDSLFPIILLVIVLSLVSKAKKKNGSQSKAEQARQKRVEARNQMMRELTDAGEEEPEAGHPARDSHSGFSSFGEGNDPCHDELLGHAYPPVAPSGSMTVAFARQDTENSVSFMAPLQAEEGVDPCHEEYLTGPVRNREPDENEDAQWQNNDLLRGIIVSQILTRPVSMRKRT